MSSLVTPEAYIDLCATTLTASYTAGAGSITVASTGAPFPQTQQFHFYIADAITKAVKAVGLATAITSGSVWAVSMTIDANASSGDALVLSLCSGAMDQIRADIMGCPLKGDPNAGTWSSYGSPFTINQNNGVHYITVLGGAPFQGRYQAAPSAPWTLEAYIKMYVVNGDDGYAGGGIFAGDSAGLVQCWGSFPNGGLRVNNFSTTGGENGQPAVLAMVGSNVGEIRLRLINDGTNLKYSFSPDGYNWLQLYSAGLTSYLASIDRIGFGGFMNNANYEIMMSLINWVVE